MIIKNKKDFIKKIIIGVFTFIPFLSSLISTVHLVNLFSLGNTDWMSIILSITFEIGSIASLLILAILDRINRGMVMSIFFILISLQIIGNLYYSFDYLNQHLKSLPNWLGSFQELIGYFTSNDIILTKLIVACLVSVPIPLISLFFLKAVVDYLKFDEPKKEIEEEQHQLKKEEITKEDLAPTIFSYPIKNFSSIKIDEKEYNIEDDIPTFEDSPKTEETKLVEPLFEDKPDCKPEELQIEVAPQIQPIIQPNVIQTEAPYRSNILTPINWNIMSDPQRIKMTVPIESKKQEEIIPANNPYEESLKEIEEALGTEK